MDTQGLNITILYLTLSHLTLKILLKRNYANLQQENFFNVLNVDENDRSIG